MKCTWLVKEGKCKVETGVPCPVTWTKHEEFHPRVLWIFFEPLWGPDDMRLDLLDAFVCPEHLPQWQEGKAKSRKALAAAAKRKAKKSTPEKEARRHGCTFLRFAAEERREIKDNKHAALLELAADLLEEKKDA